jgi:hypothetical protein
MDNFLYNIRNNSNNNNKRFDRNRKPFDGNRNSDKYNNRDKKNGQYNNKNLAGLDQLPAIKKILEDFLTNYKQGLDLDERKAKAEERKADAMEKIVTLLEGQAQPDMILPPAELPEKEPAGSSKDEIHKLISDMRSDGTSYEKIALHLEESGVPTFSGRGKWRGQTVYRLCQ